jgi:predicted Zn-dependent peptidase
VRTLKQRIEAQTPDGIRAAASGSLEPGRLTWVIVGDLEAIEQPIRELGLGPVSVLDADGRVIR